MKEKLKNLLIVFVCFFAVLFLTSGQYSYQSVPPVFIGSMVEPFQGEGVYIQAKRYSSEESKRYLHRNVHRHGVHPVQVTIQNNTNKSFVLSKDGVEMSHAHPHEVAKREYLQTVPRSVAFKVAAFLFWPFIIPGTIDTIITIKAHFALKKDFYAKSIKKEGEVVLPYSTVHRVLFVPHEDYQEGFTLTMKETQSRKLTAFPVEIYA